MSSTFMDKPRADVTAVEHSQDADIREQASIFKAFVVTVEHFFGGFERLFQYGALAVSKPPSTPHLFFVAV